MYMIRSDLITAKLICDQINSIIGVNQSLKFHIIFVPNLLTSIELLFEEEGLFGKVTFHNFSWELLQLDNRVLSFESPKIYKQLFINYDQSSLTSIAKSLWSLQHVFGTVPLALFHGKYSNIISSLTDSFMEEIGEPDKIEPDIGCMLVLDRDVDNASALLIPGTYTSLVCDVLNVNTNSVEIKKQDSEKKESAVTMPLTSEDEIYNQIKNKHFLEVFLYLKYKTNELNAEMGKRNNMNIKEMRDFVENDLDKAVNLRKTLSNHILVCERVTSQIGEKFNDLHFCQKCILDCEGRKKVIADIEDIMATGTDMDLALRLICLLSLSQNGYTLEESSNLKKQFLHAYGYEHISTFHNLEKAGLFLTAQSFMETNNLASKVAQVVSYPLPKKSQFQVVSQKMKLFPDQSKGYSLSNPQDPGYVFGGAYIPLVAQLVNYLIKKEMSLGELTKLLQGNNLKSEIKWTGKSPDAVPDISPRCILVYIVGGITYAEIAALQLIESRTGFRIICAGSSIINGNRLVESAT